MTQKLLVLILWKLHSGCCYVKETPRIINKMTNFWRLVFSSIIWLLAILCDTLIRIWGNRWLLRLQWSFSESVFRICVWMPIYVIMIYFTMNYNILIFLSNNVKGIRTSQKRIRLFEYGKSYATSNRSVFLQKIYLTTSDGMKWVDEFNCKLSRKNIFMLRFKWLLWKQKVRNN